MSPLTAASPHAARAAARWIDSYLLPLVAAEHITSPGRALRCLHIEPDDELEAIHLRRLGHDCDVLLSPLNRRHPAPRWERPPIVADMARLPLTDRRYDLIWSAAFGRLNPGPECRRASACELLRICAPGGGVLLMQGNVASPLYMRRGLRLALGPLGPHGATLAGLQQAFIGDAGFAVMRSHSLAGHFGWGSVPRGMRGVAWVLERYLRWASHPGRPARYASALNPMFALWFGRAPVPR